MAGRRTSPKGHRHHRRVRPLALAVAVVAAAASARAQIATLDKGHRILLDNGLQIWGMDVDPSYPFDYPTMAAANLTAINWGFGGSGTHMDTWTPGQKWGKWTDWHYNGTTVSPQTTLTAAEDAHKADLLMIQVGDEANQYDMESGTETRDWFLAAGNGTATTADDVFPNAILYTNSYFISSHAGYANFLSTANPDAISWDSYPFTKPANAIITPTNWLALGQVFRRHGLGSYIGATGAAPRPYGLYVQTFYDETVVEPGEAQIRWQQFAAWTMGYKFVDAFIYTGWANHFATRTSALYDQFAETARQGRNLGPALTRLISYSNGLAGGGTSFVPGQNPDGTVRAVPGDWKMFSAGDAPPGQAFMNGVTVQNLGTKNNGRPGDIYVGFFNPLLGAFANPQGEAYFMVTNGLGGDLWLPNGSSDNLATAAETAQAITLYFDFVGTRVNSLQRLRRDNGQLEVVPLTANGGAFSNLYKTTITLDGGTGDLFKYNDGTPFVGVETIYHWDPDGTAAGNNPLTGAGVGGPGAWDGAGDRWSTGPENSSPSAGGHVVFWGPAGGAVTVSAGGQSAHSLALKTNGYSVSGGPLAMSGPAVTVDAGVTATIGSAIAGTAGLNKLGPGTLVLTGANTHSGGTAVGGGVLRVTSDAALGAPVSILPTSPYPTPPDNIWLNNGTLQFATTMTLSPNRGIQIGAAGGTIDVAAGAEVTYAANRGFRGYDLVKTGPGTFFAAGTGGGTNNIWAGTLTLREGTWKVVASDGLPLNPTGGGLRAAQVTLDGGTWQWGNNANVSNANRGITVAAGGGTIDTQSFNVTWAGPISGSIATATLYKAGSGTLALRGAAYASNYPGTVQVTAGTLSLMDGRAMGDSASVVLANAAGVSLNVAGSETVGSLAGGGTTGGNVNLNANTLTTGGNGSSTTFSGTVSGASGKLAKTGTGTMTLSGPNTYTGPTTLADGTLVLTPAAFAPVTTSAGGAIVNGGRLVLDYNAGALPSSLVADLKASHDASNFRDPARRYRTTNVADPTHGLGYVDDAAAQQFTIAYTWYGDANLDGLVTADDYVLLDRGLALNLTGWRNGDFDYSGSVTPDDYLLADASFVQQTGTPSPEFLAEREARFGDTYVAALVASVPEPSAVTGLVSCGLGLLTRRRRA